VSRPLEQFMSVYNLLTILKIVYVLPIKLFVLKMCHTSKDS